MEQQSEKTITTLYNLTSEVLALDEMLESVLSSEQETAHDLQKEVFELVQKKADNCVKYDKYLDSCIDSIDLEIKRLQALKKTTTNKKENFRKYLIFCIEQMGVSKLQGATYSMTVRKPSQVLKIHDESLVPAEFVVIKQEVVLDKVKLKEALKNDTENKIMGASLVDGEKSLLIK